MVDNKINNVFCYIGQGADEPVSREFMAFGDDVPMEEEENEDTENQETGRIMMHKFLS